MEFLEAVELVKKPNDKYDPDLIALRVLVLELLKRSEEKPNEILTNDEPVKKGKRK